MSSTLLPPSTTLEQLIDEHFQLLKLRTLCETEVLPVLDLLKCVNSPPLSYPCGHCSHCRAAKAAEMLRKELAK